MTHFGVGDQIEITLAVARFHVFETVEFFRHGEQRLRKELEFFDVEG